MPRLPTPRRIALIEATMAADQADFRLQGLAVVHFYDLLSPAQQRIFDNQTAAPASESRPLGLRPAENRQRLSSWARTAARPSRLMR